MPERRAVSDDEIHELRRRLDDLEKKLRAHEVTIDDLVGFVDELRVSVRELRREIRQRGTV
jgi:uncharacterized coiled-coil protein SlyX